MIKLEFFNDMLVLDTELKIQLEPYLERNERLLWVGVPRRGIIFKPFDVFMIPFSLVWCSFAVFWTYMAAQGSIFFALFGIPFVVVGLGMLFGRFISDALNRKNTVYGFTAERILIKLGITKTVVKSVNIASLSDLELSENSDGSGTISLGPTGFKALVSSKETLPNARSVNSISYIKDARKVYMQLVQLQADQMKSDGQDA